jgi:hypothetical protein
MENKIIVTKEIYLNEGIYTSHISKVERTKKLDSTFLEDLWDNDDLELDDKYIKKVTVILNKR